jgi:leucyl-tRNA synthetase
MKKESLKFKEYKHDFVEEYIYKLWLKDKVYKVSDKSNKKPFYVLDMFPYPSGSGLHVGHPRGYIGSDVYARFKRMQGYNVLHPMGFDAFGLPAEQYAVTTGQHPKVITNQAIKRYKKQLEIIGFSYDWDREIKTIDPEYYKWTQWIFLQIYNSWFDIKKQKARKIDELIKLFEKEGNLKVNNFSFHGEVNLFSKNDWKNFSKKEKQDILMKYRLAYEGYAEVNWCKELGTVLANDEVVEKDGKLVSERGEYPVFKKNMRQWFMRITAYADRLLDGLKTVDFLDSTKEIQKNWIGRSEGSEIEFSIKDIKEKIKVFTTRVDTLFGVTYIVLAPENETLSSILINKCENKKEVKDYIEKTKSKSTEDRQTEKTGVCLKGIYAINPANNEEVQVWVADYVIATYGTGAVMAVPAHDERDFEFAKKYNLPIKQVISPVFGEQNNDEKLRNAVACFVKRPSDNKYLFIYSKHFKEISKVYGGIESNESIRDAATREVFEEAGYKANFIREIGVTESHFYHPYKKENRKLICNLVYLELSDERQYAISEEEKSLHDILWLDYSEAKQKINDEKELFDFSLFEKNFFFDSYGTVINSNQFSNLPSKEAKKQITKFVDGKLVTKYKMRDAIFARQRYWGEPIPLICDKKNWNH